MRKKYLKPDAEYVSLISAEKITDGGILDDNWDETSNPWDDDE